MANKFKNNKMKVSWATAPWQDVTLVLDITGGEVIVEM